MTLFLQSRGHQTAGLRRALALGLAIGLWLTASGGGCGGGTKKIILTGGTDGPDVFWVDTAIGADSNLTSSAVAPWKTIFRALEVSGPGDVIMVAAGTYPERLSMPPFVEIRGSGVGVTILDGGGDGPLITIAAGAQPGNSGLRDLTLQNSRADDLRGVLTISRGSPTIQNVAIATVDAYGSSTTAAIDLRDWGSAVLTNVTLTGCNGSSGAVVAVRGNGIVTPVVTNLTTTAAGVDGGLALTEGAHFTVHNSWIRAGSGAAATLTDAARLTIDNSTLQSTGDDAVRLNQNAAADCSICTLGPAAGNALTAADASRASLSRTRLTGCTGAGLALSAAAAAAAVNSIFDHNQNGVLMASGTAGPGSSFIHCTISDNTVNGLSTSGAGTGILYVFNSLITYNGSLATDQVAGTRWTIENSGLTDATGTGGSNATIANPQYTDKANGDYTIPTTSPAVDLGNPNLGSPPGAAVPADDFAGAARSTLSNPDAGAHEGL